MLRRIQYTRLVIILLTKKQRNKKAQKCKEFCMDKYFAALTEFKKKYL